LTKYFIGGIYKRKIKENKKMPIRIKNMKFYRTEDLADMLPLREISIRKYLREGKISGQKIGLFWYVSEANLNRFLQGEYAPDKK